MKIVRPLSNTEFARNVQALLAVYDPQVQYVDLAPGESCLAVMIKYSAVGNADEFATSSQIMAAIDRAMSQHVGVDTMRFVAAPRPSGVHVGDHTVSVVMHVGFAPEQGEDREGGEQ